MTETIRCYGFCCLVISNVLGMTRKFNAIVLGCALGRSKAIVAFGSHLIRRRTGKPHMFVLQI